MTKNGSNRRLIVLSNAIEVRVFVLSDPQSIHEGPFEDKILERINFGLHYVFIGDYEVNREKQKKEISLKEID